MTLNTRFIISNPLALPKDVFDYCQGIIGAVNPEWKHERYPKFGFKNSLFRNIAGQGFNALLCIEYGADGPLVKEEDNEKPDGFIEVSFDTAYAFVGPNGQSCTELHATYVEQLGKWCEGNNWEYHWQNEYTGEWFNDWRLAKNKLGY